MLSNEAPPWTILAISLELTYVTRNSAGFRAKKKRFHHSLARCWSPRSESLTHALALCGLPSKITMPSSVWTNSEPKQTPQSVPYTRFKLPMANGQEQKIGKQTSKKAVIPLVFLDESGRSKRVVQHANFPCLWSAPSRYPSPNTGKHASDV